MSVQKVPPASSRPTEAGNISAQEVPPASSQPTETGNISPQEVPPASSRPTEASNISPQKVPPASSRPVEAGIISPQAVPLASSRPIEAGIISPLEIIHIAWEGIVRNKIRSLLTMLGVIIGVAAVIIMIAISAGTEATIAEQIEGLGANLVFIQASFGRGGPGGGGNNSGPQLVYDDVEIVANISGVSGTSVEQFTDANGQIRQRHADRSRRHGHNT